MKLCFEAKYVECADALDGEILQVTFDTLPPGQDEMERVSPYVMISRNFEFPGAATIEWHDGSDYEGGGFITRMVLRRGRASARIDGRLEVDIRFSISDKKFTQLQSHLESMLETRLDITQ